jgi:hypothetical protein
MPKALTNGLQKLEKISRKTNKILKLIRITILFVLGIFSSFLTISQTVQTSIVNSSQSIVFKAHPSQKYGFDSFVNLEWKDQYKINKPKVGVEVYTAYKSIKYHQTDQVLLVNKGFKKKKFASLKLVIGNQQVPFSKFDDSTIVVKLPLKRIDYVLKAYIDDELKAKLFVQIQKEIDEKIVIVPLVDCNFKEYELRQNLNSIYRQANIQFDVKIVSPFKSKVFEPSTIFSTPNENHDQFTGQMRLLRDIYFEENPKVDKNAYYVFLIQGFEDSLKNGFMVKNKSIAFQKHSNDLDSFSYSLAQTMAFGVGGLDFTWEKSGPEKGSTFNLMDTTFQTHLTYFQWNKLRRTPNYYAIYDNEENVRTNNGTVAYYFWEEDRKGNIILKNNKILESIKRPYKHNYLSYRFKVKYAILRPFYKIGEYYISIVTILFLVLLILVLWFIRRKLKSFWEKKKYRFKLGRRLLFLVILGLVVYQVSQHYLITNKILNYFKQISGPIKELSLLDYKSAKREIIFNDKLLHEEVSMVNSEILIQKKKQWFLKKRAKVLYVDVQKDQNGKIDFATFVSSNDSLRLPSLNYYKPAFAHYIVLNYKRADGSLEYQKVYNYSGNEVSSKFKDVDPPKRILVFVNGYRPTSIGQTFEENFIDVQNNGIEFPDSKNFIYDFDRFDYWRPWNDINLLFQKRINPNETYYADGHFSVETSNYRSLINFSSISSTYPKRCENLKKHNCFKIQDATIKQFIFSNSKTINQLKLRPNRKGFNHRKYKGRIAGKNLLQILNENPEFSKNDTLYIVAHSMGFAYSQGIVEVVRGKINFGGYYIIAPENPKGGRVSPTEWKEIWQYGSNFDQKNPDAPCLQDGIAPQYRVPGLPIKNRIFISKKRNRYKGYFDSHFIGYYTWILDLKEGESGYISKK